METSPELQSLHEATICVSSGSFFVQSDLLYPAHIRSFVSFPPIWMQGNTHYSRLAVKMSSGSLSTFLHTMYTPPNRPTIVHVPVAVQMLGLASLLSFTEAVLVKFSWASPSSLHFKRQYEWRNVSNKNKVQKNYNLTCITAFKKARATWKTTGNK